jgi:hypothetical protein
MPLAHLPPKEFKHEPRSSGVFVYRHLGLLGCNIPYMKQFLNYTHFVLGFSD